MGASVKVPIQLLQTLRISLVLIGAAGAESIPIREASGITRLGNDLLIVDDSQNGAYFRFALAGERGPMIRLTPERLSRVPLPHASMATDLEAINVLSDGRVVVLSERLRALFGQNGMIADYGAPLSEFGKRGLEGLAVRPARNNGSHVAVLWEGGYPDYYQVPEQLRSRVGRQALQPVVQNHLLASGDNGIQVRGANFVMLDVPVPRGRGRRAQRFRAPDLVWHRQADGAWGFITLLSSMNSVDRPTYEHHWLQRFSGKGKRIGERLDLDAIVGEKLRGVNWEGLSWFESGKSLVMVHESHPEPVPTAYVLQLPDHWKSSAATRAQKCRLATATDGMPGWVYHAGDCKRLCCSPGRSTQTHAAGTERSVARISLLRSAAFRPERAQRK